MKEKQQGNSNQWLDGLTIALCYLICGFLIDLMPRLSFGSPLWPSAGFALGGLITRGRSHWWGVFLGAAVNGWLVSRVDFISGIVGGLIPAFGAWTATTLVLKFNKAANFLYDVRHALIFIITNTCTGTLLQSILGALNVMIAGKIPPENYWREVLNWWVGDTIGILVFAPLVSAWWQASPPPKKQTPLRWRELGIICLSLLLVSYFCFVDSQPVEYLMIPPLLWSALRLGDRLTTLLLVINSTIAAVFTLYQRGIFYQITQEFQSVVFLQLFVGIICITTIVTLALVSENNRTFKKQQEAFAQLDEINRNLEEIIQDRTQALIIANQAISELNDQLTSENLRMRSELAVTRRLQEMILPKPKELDGIEELELAGFMQPADEVGGDYYDILPQKGKIKIGIGDVTGHGLESGVIMIMVQTAIRALLASGKTNLIELLVAVNQAIYSNLKRMNCDKSLTLMLLEYQNHTLHIAGQHESVIVIRNNGKVENIDTIDLGFPIGLLDNVNGLFFDLSISLAGGDLVVLYTDGITEAENASKEFYGIDRLIQLLQNNRHSPVDQIRQQVIEDIMSFVGCAKVYDDITLVIIKPR